MVKEISSINDIPEDMKPTVSYIFSMFEEIYIVGGAVRDMIMQSATKDLDFATPVGAYEVQRILLNNNITTHDIGIEYGTVSFNLGGFDIQITTFREEFYRSGSRKPRVVVSPDIDSDLSRRDFSINSIALSKDERIDPYDGVGDISKRLIKSIGDPDIKFKDDPLRILRSFRFVSQFGFNIDDKTLLSAVSLRSNLGIVPTERIGVEFQKLMAGNYWDDALSEIADAKILNQLLKNIGVGFPVSGEDILHELSSYTAEELRLMEVADRWAMFVDALDYARNVSGVGSIDRQTLAEKLLTAFQLKKIDKETILSRISASSPSRDKSELRDSDSVEDLLYEGERQKKQNDPRWMITLATYHTAIGKEAIAQSQYKKARENLEEALKISLENHNYIIDVFSSRPEEKRDKLKGLSSRTKDRLRYCMIAEVFDDKLYSKFASSEDLISFLSKKYRHPNISANDLRATAEYVVASMYRRNPHPLTIEPFIEFLSRSDLLMDDDTIKRYIRGVIEDKIRDKSIPPKEKAQLYLQKANMAKSGSNDDSDLGFEYYDPYVDYLLNSMISSESIDKFNKFYDEFVDNATEYLKLSDSWGRYYDGVRNMYLTSASALIYGIQLSESIEKRYEISVRVVEDYKAARSAKNASRYQIYVDWFGFAHKLFHTNSSREELTELSNFAERLKSINYEDEDEGYLSQHRPDIVRKRSLLRYTSIVLGNLTGRLNTDSSKINDEVLSSLLILRKNNLIDDRNLFKALKNYLAGIEKEVDSIDKVDIPEKTLKRNRDDADEINNLLTGESETLEYKSTWQFDLDGLKYKKVKENNPDLKHETLKNIAGMMNKNGGILLIGVEDDGNVCGLEGGDFITQSSPDPRKKLDNIQKDLRNEIRTKLGVETQAIISISTLSFRDQSGDKLTVIRIEVPKFAREPILYKDITGKEIYFVRTGTSTDDAGIRAYSEAITKTVRGDTR